MTVNAAYDHHFPCNNMAINGKFRGMCRVISWLIIFNTNYLDAIEKNALPKLKVESWGS